jgi:TP901 family phage tail tape measure protein
MNIGHLSVSIGADVSSLEKDMDKATGVVNQASGKMAGIASSFATPWTAAAAIAVTAIAGVGTAIATVTSIATDVAGNIDKATGNIATGLGISKVEAGKFEGVMKSIYSNNFGESFDDIAGGVVEVNRQLGAMPDSELQNITEKAFGLRDAFGVEVPESVNAVKVLMDEFGLTSSEALDFITKGFQNGLDSSGDFVDTIREYSNLFGEAKVPAEGFFSILETGLQGGVLGTDKVADLFKEFGIRIMDGSDTTRDALSKIGIDYDTLQQQIASGSISTYDAFGIVQEGIAGLKNPLDENMVGVGLMGTQFEDMGASAVLAIDETTRKMDEITGAADTLNSQYDTLGGAWETLKRKAEVALAPIGKIILDGLKEHMPQIEKLFAWFETTAIPWITEFTARASALFGDFFGKFDQNFGPALNRLWDSVVKIGEAFGIASGPKGTKGMDIALGFLTGTLDTAVFLFDGISKVVQTQAQIWAPFITVVRTVYELIRDIVNLIPSIGGAPFFAATGGKTFQQAFGFAQGGQFVVPPGFPNDSFMMGVTSGELVTVNPAGRGDTYDQRQFNQTIHTQATQENVLASYHHAMAALS